MGVRFWLLRWFFVSFAAHCSGTEDVGALFASEVLPFASKDLDAGVAYSVRRVEECCCEGFEVP
jgi:hypothetical protein